MNQIMYTILIWLLIVGPFIASLVWVILSRRSIKKARNADQKPGCLAKASQIFSIIVLVLSIFWGLFIWFLDAVMRSM